MERHADNQLKHSYSIMGKAVFMIVMEAPHAINELTWLPILLYLVGYSDLAR